MPQSKQSCQHWGLVIPLEFTDTQAATQDLLTTIIVQQISNYKEIMGGSGEEEHATLAVGGSSFPILSHEVIPSPPEFK